MARRPGPILTFPGNRRPTVKEIRDQQTPPLWDIERDTPAWRDYFTRHPHLGWTSDKTPQGSPTSPQASGSQLGESLWLVIPPGRGNTTSRSSSTGTAVTAGSMMPGAGSVRSSSADSMKTVRAPSRSGVSRSTAPQPQSGVGDPQKPRGRPLVRLLSGGSNAGNAASSSPPATGTRNNSSIRMPPGASTPGASGGAPAQRNLSPRGNPLPVPRYRRSTRSERERLALAIGKQQVANSVPPLRLRR